MLEKLKNLLQFRKSHINLDSEKNQILEQMKKSEIPEVDQIKNSGLSKKGFKKIQERSVEISACYNKIEKCYEKRKELRLEGENKLAMIEQKLIADLHTKIEELQKECEEIQSNEVIPKVETKEEPKKKVESGSTKFRYAKDGLTKQPIPDYLDNS